MKKVLALLLSAVAISAHATPIVSVDDVTLNGKDSNKFASSSANPVSGPKGTTTGFENQFASTGVNGWNLVGKDEKGKVTVTSKDFTFTFNVDSGKKTGDWTFTNLSKQDAHLDLVLAIHAANASSAFLFDSLSVNAGKTLAGDWAIEWTKNGNIPDFSNAAVFVRDVTYTKPVVAIPEPSTVSMFALGLIGMGAFVRRKQK